MKKNILLIVLIIFANLLNNFEYAKSSTDVSQFYLPRNVQNSVKANSTVKPQLKPKKPIAVPVKKTFNAFPANSKIDLVFRNIDLPTVLKLIAEEGNKSLICDKSVKGNINLDLKQVSLNQAMQKLLNDHKLSASVNKNNIYVKKILPVASTATKPEVSPVKKTVSIPLPVKNTNTVTVSKTTAIVSTPLISLTDYIKVYNAPYTNTFSTTLNALSLSKAEVINFNSKLGKINARVNNWKSINITLQSSDINTTSVKITPTDGVYNISPLLVKEIFNNINKGLIIK
jgi:hypothetical protein